MVVVVVDIYSTISRKQYLLILIRSSQQHGVFEFSATAERGAVQWYSAVVHCSGTVQ